MVSVQSPRTLRTIPPLIIVCLLGLPVYAKYSGGTGEPNDPYQIATAADLIALGEATADYDKHFILTADIDLDPNLPGRKVFDRAVIAPDVDDMADWFQGTVFVGVFDGKGHTISNLTIVGDSYLGVFGALRWGGEARNLGLLDVSVTGSGAYVGGLAGESYATPTVTRCYSTGAVNGRDYLGGLVGYNGGRITASYSTASVKGDGGVGGLVGENWGSIATSYSTGSVSGTGWGVGGLVGCNVGSIVASYGTGSVSGTGWCVGGLVGYNDGSIVASYSSGVVGGTENIGGLAGDNWGSIVASCSSASVGGTSCVGGLAGDNSWGSIASSYSSGSVSGAEHVGGLVGKDIDIGIHGNEIRGSTSVSFWDVQSSGQATSAGGIGLMTVEMQDIVTFLDAGWDFVGEVANGTCDFWQMSPGGYPQPCYIATHGPSMAEGLGTAEQPYLIRDARDLGTVWFEPMAHYHLTQSIDLSGITWSTAVIPLFDGTFDGGGHVISNLRIQGGGYLGLFGQLYSTASVSDLGLEAVEVCGTGDCVGGLTGYNSWSGSVITRCHSNGSVSGNDGVGGLVGYSSGTVTQCSSSGTVSGLEDVGGLVGGNGGFITTSYAIASVSGGSSVGGLVGYNGLAGITASYSSGSVSGDGFVGGLVGRNHRGSIATSYSTGRVSGNTAVGGLVGSDHQDMTGPWFDLPSRSCFWDAQTSGQATSAWGTGKTTAEMQTAKTFLDAGWDFVGEPTNGTADIWWILEGKDYPRLWWEAHQLMIDD